MSDVADRDDLEKEIGRKLGKMLKAQMGKLLELMGDPPDITKVPESFWEESGAEFTEIVRPFLSRIFTDQAEKLLGEIEIGGVDWALINEEAVRWARQYTFDLVRGINQTSRDLLQKAVGSYFEDALTRGELEGILTSAFGPIRAEMIAVTEVTRAAARGEDALWVELKEQGIELVTSWNTNNDELVCPTCGPLHDKEADGRDSDGTPFWIHPETGEEVRMPAHPRCRCNENNTLPG